MDKKDGRAVPKTPVPLGTFRASTPPPPRPGADSNAVKPLPPPAAMPAPPDAEPSRQRTEKDGAKFSSTLVGHPSKDGPPPVPAAAVLAPPKWRGAQAYEAAEAPELRVSSIATAPAHPGAVPHPDDRRVPNTRITAAAPPPPPPPVEAKPAPIVPSQTAAIGEAIQQLLDSQASVPIDSAGREDPTEELVMDDVLETYRASDPNAPPAHAVVTSPPPPPPESLRPRRAPEPPEDTTQRMASAFVDDEPAPDASAQDRAQAPRSSQPRWSAPLLPTMPIPQDEGHAEHEESPDTDHDEPAPDHDLARYSFVESDPPPAPTTTSKPPRAAATPREPGSATSRTSTDATPARAASAGSSPITQERVRELFKVRPDGSAPGIGIAYFTLMAAVLVLGWYFTRGGFKRPNLPAPPAVEIATASPDVVPADTVAEPPAKPAQANAPQPAETESAPLPPTEAPAKSVAPAATSARPQPPQRTEPEAKPQLARAPSSDPAPAPASPAPSAVLKLTPRQPESPAAKTTAPSEPESEAKVAIPPLPTPDPLPPPSGELPDTPTRETVQAALDSVRAEVARCAPEGQHGVAEVDLTIASNGLVTHAVVAGDFAGSAAGSCIARAVRGARFTPFAKPRFRVIYPFSL